MLRFSLFKKSNDNVIPKLYQDLIQQSRLPWFFTEAGIDDTNQERFELICLHMYLILNRIKANKIQSQKLFDFFFQDMDRNIREMGVGDLGVGRKIKEMITYLYDRIEKYKNASPDYTSVLLEFFKSRNVKSGLISAYMLDQLQHLNNLTDDAFDLGKVTWKGVSEYA